MQIRWTRMHEIGIFSDRQLSTLAQICALSLPPHLTIESLYVYEDQSSLFVWNDIKNTKWLDLLLLYTAVKNLFLSKIFSPRMWRIALALQGLTRKRVMEVLPALQNVLLQGFQAPRICPGGIAEFISARQVRSPITLSPLPGIENSIVNNRRG